MKAEYLNKIIEALIELIDEGVYIVDQDGVGKFYNKAMASMEKVNIEDVLGKKFHEAFPDFSLSESTMFEALKKTIRLFASSRPTKISTARRLQRSTARFPSLRMAKRLPRWKLPRISPIFGRCRIPCWS